MSASKPAHKKHQKRSHKNNVAPALSDESTALDKAWIGLQHTAEKVSQLWEALKKHTALFTFDMNWQKDKKDKDKIHSDEIV